MSTQRPLCALRTHGLAALVSILAFVLAAFVAPRGEDELTLAALRLVARALGGPCFPAMVACPRTVCASKP